MSGRTFGVQSSWDDVFRQMGLDVDPASLRKGIGIADSMNQQIEEFLNRYVTTSLNDDGDITFDAAGTYTFEGSIEIAGNVTLTTAGTIRTADSGHRTELTTGDFGFLSETLSGLRLYSGDGDEDAEAKVAVTDGGTEGSLLLYGPNFGAGQPYIRIRSGTTVGDMSMVIATGGGNVQMSGTLGVTGSDSSNPPAVSVGADDTGIYGNGTGRLGIAVGGNKAGYAGVDGWRMVDGSATNPAYSFEDATDTGMYRSGTNTIGFSSNNTAIAAFNTAQARFDTDVEVNDGRLWVKNDGSGTSTVLIDNDMLLLTANGMNISSKYTPPIVFGSTDSAFTTENPKALAAIVGVASEAYVNDSDGGMYLEFVINGTNPGAANAVNSSSHGYLMQTSGFKPRNDNVADCGGASNRWDDVYATNGTIVTSDLREKTLVPGEELGLGFLLALEGYAFVRDGGTRIHHGIGAQDVIAALGDDARQHAIWIQGEDGRLGVRHDELWGPAINAFHTIDARLSALEAAIMAA